VCVSGAAGGVIVLPFFFFSLLFLVRLLHAIRWIVCTRQR
jgi:hypothetical protein